MSERTASIQSIAIIGAGIIGLSCALELADRGVRVTLYEKQWPPRGASWAAAGMLAPAFEAIGVAGNHPGLFELCDASARLWPDWASRLEARTGRPSGYNSGPSLALAFDAEAAQKLALVQRALADHDQAPSNCTENLTRIDSSVGAGVQSALLLPSDGQVDNRLTLAALVACIETHDLIRVQIGDASLAWTGARADHAGHDATLLTAGWQTGAVKVARENDQIDILELDPLLAEIGPIGGQMLAVAPIEGGPRMTIRSGHVYIVPKADRIIIGATSEPGRALTQPVADQIAALRDQAIRICPILENAPILESWAGVRPGLKNHAPLLGETQIEKVFVAAGHYRNGILLAPLTAQIMANLIIDGKTSPLTETFAPKARYVEQL
ncbi:MAG: FAD-dependent oxidoreductase [Henriciella sp.]